MTTITLTGAMTLGRLLQMFRQIAGIDQTEMGKALGVARPTISAWERDIREPSFSQVVAWAKITGQPLEALVEAVNAETPSAEAESVSTSVSTQSAPQGTRTPNLLIGSSLAALNAEYEALCIIEAVSA